MLTFYFKFDGPPSASLLIPDTQIYTSYSSPPHQKLTTRSTIFNRAVAQSCLLCHVFHFFNCIGSLHRNRTVISNYRRAAEEPGGKPNKRPRQFTAHQVIHKHQLSC